MPDTLAHEVSPTARDVRVAARALARAGLVHAYGHCSARIDSKQFLVSPAKPLGLIDARDEAVRVPCEGALPPGALPEVIIHQHVYRTRADVGGIARFQSPHVMALSALGRTPRALHGFGAYFAPRPPIHLDPRLARNDASAAAIVQLLGSGRAVILRGNGAVTVGATLHEAVAMAWYLEDAARVELAVLGCGVEAVEFSPQEAADRAASGGNLPERMWDFLTAGDSEVTH
jgi:HCOMODA/2-hydroxy-3-carboxy-muconic semialdehyde decarboxylase